MRICVLLAALGCCGCDFESGACDAIADVSIVSFPREEVSFVGCGEVQRREGASPEKTGDGEGKG